ncbi:hypothetical protein T265_13953, partial [Opisthorchis viverrini]
MIESPNRSMIHEAVKLGDLKSVKKMISEGADVNEADDQSFTPLHWATNVLQYLLWKGADPNIVTTRGWCALHIAAIRGYEPCIQSLVDRGVCLSTQDSHGLTPGHLAAIHGNSGCLLALLKSGADVETVDGHGWTMLHCAAFHGRLGCVQVLLRWGLRVEDVDKSGNSAVHLAAMEGHLPVLQCLIIQHPTPLLLLDTPNDLGETPESLSKRFLKEDVSGFIETVKKEHGLRPVDEARFFATAFPAHSAAYDGDLTTLRTLIEEGVIKVNERDEQGSTPLHKAAGQGHVKIIHWLLENGADPSITNHLGERPVDVARRFGQSAAIEPLKVRDPHNMVSEKIPGFLEGEPEPEVILDKEIALERARKRIDKFQKLLDLAKSDYKQLGGEPDPEELHIQCEIRENE